MAEKYPAANGNWSTAANWNGGTLPVAGDDVYANGKTITIDQDVNVASLRTTAGATAVAGGGFACSSARTITASIICGTSIVLTLSNGVGVAITLNGNITCSITSSVNAVSVAGNGPVNINGTLTGAVSGTTTGAAVAISTATPNVTITGNLTGGNTNGNYGLNVTNSMTGGSVTVTGNVRAHPTGAGNGIITQHSGGTVTVNGNVNDVAGGTSHLNLAHTGTAVVILNGDISGVSTINAAYGATFSSTGIFTVNGNVYGNGNTTGTGYGINFNGAGTLTVNGTVKGGTGLTAPGIIQSGGGTCYIQKVQGNDYPNSGVVNGNPGWQANAITQVVTIEKMEFGSGGTPPVASGRVFINDAAINECKIRQSNAGAITTMGDVPADYTDPANVRYGVSYAFGTRTGTLRVPPAGSVAYGVPVDAGTGTAALLTQAQVAAIVGPIVAAANP